MIEPIKAVKRKKARNEDELEIEVVLLDKY